MTGHDPIRRILEMSQKEWDAYIGRLEYEWRCERRAKRWFGWQHPFFEWSPEERRTERRRSRAEKRERKRKAID